MQRSLRGHVTRAQRDAPHYFYVPFEVPERTERLEVRLDYSSHEGENILDLGVADLRFKPEVYPNAHGFRGWSGSFRDRFVITSEAATPGYLPGPLFTGTWHVLLGLHKVAAAGCDYALELLFDEPSDMLTLPLTPH